jgi:hypothetical protein
MDSGATSHMASHPGILSSSHPPCSSTPSSIIVGDGSYLPITATGSASVGNLHLNNVLVSPQIIKNLVSVRRFTTDNNCSVEFDPRGFSVKDLRTRSVITRCNSSGPLYPMCPPLANTSPHAFLTSVSSELWHQRLGHLGHEALSHLARSSVISCNKDTTTSNLCHACQLGRHVRLPFPHSQSRASRPFDLVHCDLWTSPLSSVSGFKYYLVILDDYSHHVWTFRLRLKFDTFSTIAHFFAYVATQFGCTIKSMQCDNGREFDNSSTRAFFLTHGVHLRMSCPYTSQQNGKVERVLHTLNNIIRSLLFQAHLPPACWVEALHTATYLLNRHPTSTLHFSTPFHTLHGHPPSYDHLRVFGCRCYPNLSSTTPHKLAPRSTLCVFLGYSSDHKGYRCLDLTTNRVIISHHVVFNESSFPFAEASSSASPTNLDFLDDFSSQQVMAPSTLVIPGAAWPTRPPAAPGCHPGPLPGGPLPGGPSPLRPPGSPGPSPRGPSGLPPGTPPGGLPPSGGPPPGLPGGLPPPPGGLPGGPPPPSPLLPGGLLPSAPGSPTVWLWAGLGQARSARVPRLHPVAPVLPPGAVPVPPIVNDHVMRTRAKSGFKQPSKNLHAATLSPVPTSVRSALTDPNWRGAMEEEFQALISNNTWTLVPRPPHANVVTGKWIFRHKLHSDGTLDRYKARWVLRGFTQRPGVDFDETFSPVVKPATIRTVLSLALSNN